MNVIIVFSLIDPIVAALKLILVPVTTATVVPAGIFVPCTNMPTCIPRVLVNANSVVLIPALAVNANLIEPISLY